MPDFIHCRILLQCRKRGTVTAAWIAAWRGYIQVANPPIRCSLAPALEYLRPFFQGSAYLGKDESVRALKRQICGTQLAYEMVEMQKMTPRIQRKQPAHHWWRIWQNISGQHLSTTIHAMWFRAVQDIIPTNERLYRIRLLVTPTSRTCNQTDTTLHRVMSCLGARDIWHLTRFPIALMLRIDPQHVPSTWLRFPALHIWPAPRHNAIIWLLSREVYFALREHPPLDLKDYMDFMRPSRWRTYQWSKRTKVYGNYLDVLDWTASTTH
jgi:hypothetical protein